MFLKITYVYITLHFNSLYYFIYIYHLRILYLYIRTKIFITLTVYYFCNTNTFVLCKFTKILKLLYSINTLFR